MKKALLPLLALLAAGAAHANDTYFFTSLGNLYPAKAKSVPIQMKSELISIVLEQDHYEVTVDFDFRNTGKEQELLVGFPYFEAGGGHGKIYDFKCWTNGELTDYSDMPIDREFSNSNYDADTLESAYTRTIRFPAKSATATKVSYKSEYGYDTDGRIISYLYGTGSSWKGDIGEMTFRLENRLPHERPDKFTIQSEDSVTVTRIADNKWEAHCYHVKPAYTDCISVHAQDIFDDTGPKSFPAYFRFHRVKADSDWLFWYTKAQLRLVRNTIYALHGYEFKSEDLRQLFVGWGQYWSPPLYGEPRLSRGRAFRNGKAQRPPDLAARRMAHRQPVPERGLPPLPDHQEAQEPVKPRRTAASRRPPGNTH